MRRARTERPENFEVDLSHPLMRGAVLLGLGQAHHSIRYRDESAKGNHGTLTGYTGAGNTPADRWGRALGRAVLEFNGSSDDVPLDSSLFNCPSFTAAAWVRFDAVNKYHYVWARDDDGTSRYFVLGCDTGARPYAVVWNASNSLAEMRPSVTVTAKSWYHLALTYIPGSQKVYLNGRVIDTATLAGDAKSSGTTPTHLGKQAGSAWLAGAVGDAVFWSRALSPAEIMQLADPSNVMLSGAIREPRPRRNFIGQVAAKPWLYAHRRSSRVIGVGI